MLYFPATMTTSSLPILNCYRIRFFRTQHHHFYLHHCISCTCRKVAETSAFQNESRRQRAQPRHKSPQNLELPQLSGTSHSSKLSTCPSSHLYNIVSSERNLSSSTCETNEKTRNQNWINPHAASTSSPQALSIAATIVFV